jgi:hypothetical protein
LNDLPNGAALAQEILVGSVLPIIEILAIKDHKLNNTFLHVAFRSQSLLKPTDDKPALIPIEGLEKVTRGR